MSAEDLDSTENRPGVWSLNRSVVPAVERGVTRATVFLASVALAVPAFLAPAHAADACASDPFDDEFVAEIERRWPDRGITAEVEDLTDGCRYSYRPERVQSTASVIKITIMAATLLRAQDEERPLSAWERARLQPMMRISDDPTASALWVSLGGSPGVQATLDRFGLRTTTAVSPRWGASLTTAADQVDLIRQVVLGGGPLDAEARSLARGYLNDVAPDQRWGATAGVPDAWEVPLKNGFFPSAGWGWRLNSVGLVVGPSGPRWAVAILTDGWQSDTAGIEAVEFIGGRIARAMLRFTPPVAGADLTVD